MDANLLKALPAKYILLRLVCALMFWLTSSDATLIIVEMALFESCEFVPVDGFHGANPISIGRLDSTMVHESASTAVALPFVVVVRVILVVAAAVVKLKDDR